MLANVSDIAYMSVHLTETATGRHPKIAIVGTDGNPSPAVHYPPFEGGTRLVIPPASRFAIAVTIPARGDLVLEMPSIGEGARTASAPGILYTNDGSGNPPATLGTLSILPSAVSYYDGFFYFPTQVLARAVPSGGQGVTIAFKEGQKLGAYSAFNELSKLTPDFTRKLTIMGGFLNDLASKDDPKSFTYAYEGIAFPNVMLLQPRLNSVEEWTFINKNNDEHPIHVHVNDFQVTSTFDPTTGLRTGPDMWEVDNANVPAPTLGPNESVIQTGDMSMRTLFEDYTGLFVQHCHRLNHEDNGLMTLVNVIPAVSSYAVAIPGSAGHAAQVKVYDANGDKLLGTVTPFPGYEGSVSVAMGDVDDDNLLDLVVGAGKDHAPEVVAFSGKAKDGKDAFATELARFAAFDADARGGVSVTSTQIDGLTADNIVVGSGPGITSEVKVFSTKLPRTRARRPNCSRRSVPIREISPVSLLPRDLPISLPGETASSPRRGRAFRPKSSSGSIRCSRRSRAPRQASRSTSTSPPIPQRSRRSAAIIAAGCRLPPAGSRGRKAAPRRSQSVSRLAPERSKSIPAAPRFRADLRCI